MKYFIVAVLNINTSKIMLEFKKRNKIANDVRSTLNWSEHWK